MKGYLTNTSIGSYGRFANGMYQIAAVFGIARKNGLEPVFPLWQNKDHRDRFGSSEDIDLYKHFVNPLPAIPSGIRFTDKHIQWGYHDVKLNPGNWNISGHFQSLKYFEHCFDEVKWYMRMKDEPELNDYCAIHVRLGDYDGGYHPRLDLAYYAQAIEHFDRSQRFLLFSDDPSSAMKILQDYKLRITMAGNGDYIKHFKMMKACRHFIIGNSTYSAMSAILGEAEDKKVIAPSPWFGAKYTQITGKDIYCPDWTVINYEQQKITA